MLTKPKKGTAKRERQAKRRTEKDVLAEARVLVFARDRECRFPRASRWAFPCGGGPDQLAHLQHQRRSKTGGAAPELRHDPEGMLRLCPNHHHGYDGSIGGRLFDIEAPDGASGVCRFVGVRTGFLLGES